MNVSYLELNIAFINSFCAGQLLLNIVLCADLQQPGIPEEPVSQQPGAEALLQEEERD